MLLSMKVKILPTHKQKNLLRRTMVRFNEACNYIADIAFAARCANKINLQKIVYYDAREKFQLSAQLTIRAIAKVVEAYKRDKQLKPRFSLYGGIIYDQRILSWKGLEFVSLATIEGRQIIPVIFWTYHRLIRSRIRGQVDLIYHHNRDVFYLNIVVEVPETPQYEPKKTIGVDLGIVNLAVDSTGEIFSGDDVNNIRRRFFRLRGQLQRTGTKSAKRHLKKLSGKERRFASNVNHVISKKLVAKAKGTRSLIVLEDLTGIRQRATVRKAYRGRLHSWAFYQLRQFISYKAALAGVPVVFVDPRNTSRRCPSCGYLAKKNRRTRDDFCCVQCGFAGLSDHIAAINIAVRALVNVPIVSELINHSDCYPPGTSPDTLAWGN